MRNGFRQAAFGILIGGAALWGLTAQAAPITGTFTLVNDAGELSFPAGAVLGSGTFTTNGVIEQGPGPFSGVDISYIETLSFFDQTADTTLNPLIPTRLQGIFGDFVYNADGSGSAQNAGLFPWSSVTPLFAVLDFENPRGVVALEGSLMVSGTPSVYLSLTADSVVDGNGDLILGAEGGFDLASSAGNFGGTTESGVQSIPEPSAIALLGAGLVAFGFVARRRRSS